MIRGVSASKSGMAAEQIRTEVLANNLANINTAGFKRSVAAAGEFQAMLIQRLDDQTDGQSPVIGLLGSGAHVEQVHSVTSQGEIIGTDRALDLAISGKGQFRAQGPDGQPFLTRNGAFRQTVDGTLVTTEGYPVLIERTGGQVAPLTALGVAPEIRTDGTVLVNGEQVGRLAMEGADDETRILAGALESANVELAKEMADLIVSLRSFQVNQRALAMQDETLGKAVNEIGKV